MLAPPESSAGRRSARIRRPRERRRGRQSTPNPNRHQPDTWAIFRAVTFEEADLARIAAAEEIEIETRSADGKAHRTIIWAVVADGVIRVRSVNGPGARWYREATADPNVAIHLGADRWPARAIPASGPADVEA